MISRTIRPAILTAAVLLLSAAVCLPMGRAADATLLPEDAYLPEDERLTDQQQQAALEFVKEHHPQLNTLITRLKKRDPAEYHTALDEVHSTLERLARQQSRDPQRYEVDLKLWKVESRIRLLAARMAADKNTAVEGQLRDLLNERSDLRLQQLTLERTRLTERIERIDNQISQFAGERDAAIDKEIDRLRRSVRSRSNRVSRKSAGDTAPASEVRKSDRPRQPGKASTSDNPPTPATDKPET